MDSSRHLGCGVFAIIFQGAAIDRFITTERLNQVE